VKKIDAKFHARILVVEDYPINAELTKEMLEMMECHVEIAEDGEEALAKYREGDYDLIFMDIQIPKKDGVAVVRQIRKEEAKKRHTPIVALTANALQEHKEQYLAAGMDDYLSKPIRAESLEEILSRHLPE